MITKNERTFLSRTSLGFMAVFLLILSYWGKGLAGAIVYPVTGLISFFVHCSKFGIKKWSVVGILFLIISFVIGPPLLLYSAFQKKDDT
ncbi:hypothetical protein H7X65_02095 [Candidatus Parcubacteria bacterium]|nr:hypothetical protein [Candidatus Parcubacteria bacterium]